MPFRLFLFFSILFSLFFAGCGGTSGSNGAAIPDGQGVQATETKEAVLIPTIYRLLVVFKDRQTCPFNMKKSFYTVDSKRLQMVCPDDYNRCRLEGSCDIIENGRTTPIGFLKQVGAQDYWRIYDRHRCPFGSGYQDTCLDPFRSVAADMNYWKIGDVIYIPAVDGVDLPDGSTHDGFFVVRDTGGAINGPHRFDFYVGRSSQKIVINIFSKLKLNDRQTQVMFRKATPSEASLVRAQRRFPDVPR